MFRLFLYLSVLLLTKGLDREETYRKTLTESLKRQFCLDNSSLTIDAIVESGSSGFLLYFKDHNNTKYEIEAVSNRSDHFPDFLGWRIAVDEKIETTTSSKYTFVNEYGVYLAKRGDRWRFAGFNQVWLGCPQPMCLHTTIDSALSLNADRVFITRGRHLWTKKTPEAFDASEISEKGIQFADCGYYKSKGGAYRLFKGDIYYESKDLENWSGPNEIKQLYSKWPEERLAWLTNSVAAASFNKFDLFFSGTYLCVVYKTLFKRYIISAELPTQLHNIDAAVFKYNEIFVLFKGYLYAEVKITVPYFFLNPDVKIEITREWQNLRHYFNCDYSKTIFRNHQNYWDIIGKYIDNENLSWPTTTTAATTKLSKPTTERKRLNRTWPTTSSSTSTMTVTKSDIFTLRTITVSQLTSDASTLSTRESNISIWSYIFVFALIVIIASIVLILIILVALEFKKGREKRPTSRKLTKEGTGSTIERPESTSSFSGVMIESAGSAIHDTNDTIGGPPDAEHSIIKPKKVAIIKFGTSTSITPKQKVLPKNRNLRWHSV